MLKPYFMSLTLTKVVFECASAGMVAGAIAGFNINKSCI